MPTLNIRIVELLTQEKHTSINSFHVLLHTSNHPNKITKMKITSNKNGNVLHCEKNVSLFIPNQIGNYIYLDLKRYHFVISDDLIGQLVLPLDWFPTNHVVREWFPFVQSGNFMGGMILLDIHVDARNVDPFMAPFTALRVFPCWKRPTLCENSEIPIIPPIVYIVSPQQPSYSNETNQTQQQALEPPSQQYINIMPVNPYSRTDNLSNIPLGYATNQQNEQHLQLMRQQAQEQINLEIQMYQQQNQIHSQNITNNEQSTENQSIDTTQRPPPMQIYSLNVDEIDNDEIEKINHENSLQQQEASYQPQNPAFSQYPNVYNPMLAQSVNAQPSEF